jgi:hypothetical protein
VKNNARLEEWLMVVRRHAIVDAAFNNLECLHPLFGSYPNLK